MTTTLNEIVWGDQEGLPLDLYGTYRSTRQRAPARALVDVPLTLSGLTCPGLALSAVVPEEPDLTHSTSTGSEAIGQRSIVTGRVLLEPGQPIPNTSPAIWLAHAHGQYRHPRDQHARRPDSDIPGSGRPGSM